MVMCDISFWDIGVGSLSASAMLFVVMYDVSAVNGRVNYVQANWLAWLFRTQNVSDFAALTR